MLAIGEVAARAGLSVSAIRYFEEQGLLPAAPRRGGRRVYDASVLDRLALIELAKNAGLTIREIRQLLAGMSGRRPAASSWRRLAETKLVELDEQITRTSQMRDLLATLVTCECPTLEDCGRALSSARASGKPKTRPRGGK